VAEERIDSGAPEIIQDLFSLPYSFTKQLLAENETVLDVGGGEERLGHHLLGAKDIDVDAFLKNDFTGSILDLPFKDKEYETVICFETIEHVKSPLKAVSELVRVASKQVIVGSVNSAGRNFIGGNVAIWKGSSNEFHLSEMNNVEFKHLLSGLNAKFYSSMYALYPSCGFVIVEGNFPEAVVNYAIIRV